MSDSIRFHLDESVDPAIAAGLRRRGAEVTTSQEANLLNSSDEQQLAYALSTGRVLVTHDEDFLAVSKSGVSHGGIAYCHLRTRSIGQIIAGLMLLRDCLTWEDMKDHVEFI